MKHSTPQPSALKVCTMCGQSKPLSQYTQRKSGRQAGLYEARCKTCMAQLAAEWRAKNPERHKESHRKWLERNREHSREYARHWKNTHPGHYQAYAFRRYRDDVEFREKMRERSRLRRILNPDAVKAGQRKRAPSRNWATEEVRARAAVNRAVKRGDLPPANSMVCESCQEACAAEYHHHRGYGERFKLDVVALCFECHGRHHRIVP